MARERGTRQIRRAESGRVGRSKRCARVFAGFNSQGGGAGAAGGLRVDQSDNSFGGRLPSPAAFLFPNEAGRPAGPKPTNHLLFIHATVNSLVSTQSPDVYYLN